MKLHEATFRFDWHDVWVGVYWNRTWLSLPTGRNQRTHSPALKIIICPIPCLAISFTFLLKAS